VKYAWIKQHAADFSINRLCGLMDVSRSAYYHWLRRSPTSTEIIVSAFEKSRATYGTRRLKKVLFQQNQTASRSRIGRLMRDAKLACNTSRKFKATTNAKHNLPLAENHLGI